MPEISVIVPVYKAEAFLRKCVDSILNQSFPDFELLLVDDGSPDGSGALCDAIAAEDSRVRVFHKENGGVSSARNLALEKAEGKYIAFADSDDWFSSDTLEKLYRAAEEAGADSAGCAHWQAEVTGETVREPGAMPGGVYGPAEIRRGIVDRLLGERMGKPGEVLNGFIWRFLFTREIILQHKIKFAGAYLEDELFLMEYFCHAEKLVMLEEPLYFYLQNPTSATRRYLPDYMKTFTAFMKAKEKLAEEQGLGENFPLWRENSNWSGLLIAVGNEYAPGNPASFLEKKRRVKALVNRPEMVRAIQAIHPQNLGRNKQIVADLICRRQYFLLTALYAVKNRNR